MNNRKVSSISNHVEPPNTHEPLIKSGTVVNHSIFVKQSYAGSILSGDVDDIIANLNNLPQNASAQTTVIVGGHTLVNDDELYHPSFSNNDEGELVVTMQKGR